MAKFFFVNELATESVKRNDNGKREMRGPFGKLNVDAWN